MSTEQHAKYMRRCWQLAARAKQQGNTAVGSLVVWEDRIVAEAEEEVPQGPNLTGHAEALACQRATETLGTTSLADAILYTTAEPCFMCSYLIRQCEVALVVYGKRTPRIGGITSEFPILIAPELNDWKPAPQVIGGV